MQFFDDKEDVMDVILTPFGKHLLSQGRLDPTYYAFYDDDILYDSGWASGSNEVQNNIETRIQNDTPRSKQQSVFSGVETSVKIRNDLIRQALTASGYTETTIYVAQDTENNKIYNQEALQQTGDRFDFMNLPLGRSGINSKRLPAWNLSMLKGEISGSSGSVSTTSGFEQIPQMNITMKYKIYVDEMGNTQPALTSNSTTVAYSNTIFPTPETTPPLNVSGEISPDQFTEIASLIFDDGTYFSIENGKIIIDLLEENVDFKKENFDIQVFLSGAAFDGNNGEPLQLYYKADEFAPSQNDDVEKYLTIRTDKQISDSRITFSNLKTATGLVTDSSTTNVISTREFLIKDLYGPEEDICD
mgnify:FL=1